jgi:hypothetical protein
MKRSTLGWFLLAAVVCAPVAAHASSSVGVSVQIGNAPPPPVVVFRQEPRLVVVPNSTVYVVQDDVDYDVFRYGVFWYVFDDGYWYRARTYRGPFRVVSARYVPTAIVSVPPRWWRHPHGGPPGQMKKQGEFAMERGHGDREGHGRHGHHDHD